MNADVKGLLKLAASNLAAMMVINYDLSGFPTMIEAQTRLDVLEDTFNRALALLKEEEKTDFITNT